MKGTCLANDSIIRNVCADANTYNLQGHNVVINCSTEHMSDGWFNNIDPNALVCIQSSDVDISFEEPWLVTNPVESLEKFAQRFPMRETMIRV